MCWASLAVAQTPQLQATQTSAQGAIFQVEAPWPQALSTMVALQKANPDTDPADWFVALSGTSATLSSTWPLPALSTPTVRVLAHDFEEIPFELPPDTDAGWQAILTAAPAEVVGVGMYRKQPVGTLVTRLLHYDADRKILRRTRRMTVEVSHNRSPQPQANFSNPHLAVNQSVLATGTWFKFPVTTSGLYRIDASYLDALGLSSGSIDPNEVHIFGNGGQPLPAENNAPRIADLQQISVFTQGGGDGSFGSGDAVYFYAHGPTGWVPDDDTPWPGYAHYVHPFSTENAYFLTVGGHAPKTVGTGTFPNYNNPQTLTTFPAQLFVEEDIHNRFQERGIGSGLDWLGPQVDSGVASRTILDITPPNNAGGTVSYRARAVVRSNPTDTLYFSTNGQVRAKSAPGFIILTGQAAQVGRYARDEIVHFSETVNAGASLKVDMRIGLRNDISQGWIDWVEVVYSQQLQAINDVLAFHTPARQTGEFELILSGFSAEPHVWDISDAGQAQRLGVQPGNVVYRVQTEVTTPNTRRDLVAFVPSTNIPNPPVGVAVAHQDLHGIGTFPEFVIITPAEFRSVADELADFRRAEGLQVHVANIEEVYNEFSGGVPDMRAIRDYFKFLYDRGPSGGEPALKYALLLGDGHYDFRGLTENPSPNLIFPYQTQEMLHRDRSFTSDDYFGLLDDNEGDWFYSVYTAISNERVDIGVGRIPAQTIEDAATVLAKIKQYENPATYGSWRTRYTFVADDEWTPSNDDNDLHTQNADVVAQLVAQTNPEVNLRKIYTISYPSEFVTGGKRIPQAVADIKRVLEEGTLLWNYSGHGGYDGLADERIFTIDDIQDLDNANRLSIFVTATCSFGHWDIIEFQSGAEELLNNPSGGAVALLTTVRTVFTSSSTTTLNVGLNREMSRHLLQRDPDGLPRRLGDALRLTKNTTVGLQNNNRKFNLLGDPTMRIGLPRRQVEVTTVNGTDVTTATAPLKALDRVTIQGQVLGPDGTRDVAFRDTVEVTVFDAQRSVAIPSESVWIIRDGSYLVQNDLIYRGKVRAQDGVFSLDFVVPKDISYSNENGRISLYAQSVTGDGLGATSQVLVGGTSDNPVQDVEGPQIRLFLNDTTFVSGGLTNPEPTLIVRLFDENGINTVGTGVGHEMLLTIDGDEANAVDIGNNFEGDLGSFQQGTVSFALPEQALGAHTLSVKAWDVVNNSGTAALDYYVAAEENLAVRNIYNYPNPMRSQTRFIFEHNQPAGTMGRVQIRIYTLNGRPIKTIERDEPLPVGLVQIPWDGLDEEGDPLQTGIYLYKVRVEVADSGGVGTQVAEKVEKIAIIR